MWQFRLVSLLCSIINQTETDVLYHVWLGPSLSTMANLGTYYNKMNEERGDSSKSCCFASYIDSSDGLTFVDHLRVILLHGRWYLSRDISCRSRWNDDISIWFLKSNERSVAASSSERRYDWKKPRWFVIRFWFMPFNLLALWAGLYEERQIKAMEVFPDPLLPSRDRVLSSLVDTIRIEEKQGLINQRHHVLYLVWDCLGLIFLLKIRSITRDQALGRINKSRRKR
jgi:hypothetical protein